MNVNKRRGSLLLEATICLPLLLMATVITATLIMSVWLKFSLFLDSYALARAHLYSNQLNVCRPSLVWPKELRPFLSMSCDYSGNVKSEFRYPLQSYLGFVLPEVSLLAKVSLSEGI